jgi:hypothetical protein
VRTSVKVTVEVLLTPDTIVGDTLKQLVVIIIEKRVVMLLAHLAGDHLFHQSEVIGFATLEKVLKYLLTGIIQLIL